MKGDERLEDQIRQFYDSVPDVGDALPMKDYLLKHENNQMAWYLLGKQYAARGEEGKAHYCFAQSGPVFEAFERREYSLAAEAQAAAGGARRGLRRLSRAAAAAAGLAALLLGVLLAGGHAGEREPAAAGPAAAGGRSEAAAGGAPQAAAGAPAPAAPAAAAGEGAAAPRRAVVAGAADPAGDGPATLGALLAKTPAGASSLLVRSPLLDGRWTDWLAAGQPLAAVSVPASGDASAVVWLDPQWCSCTRAADPAEAKAAVAAWKPEQEAKLALRSAVVHYHERTGEWPASEADLAGAYPANVMAGWTDAMTGWLGELEADWPGPQAPAAEAPAPGWPDGSGPGEGRPGGKLASLTGQPLEIIVDKKRHRLAVVSGGVLLRNYEVGLGGSRTPEGAFVITEKVRNPNGHSDGEFGSRGMTLSDTLYAIHGTDDPDSIGLDESQGCIRMRQDDLEELYDLVPLGTKVTIAEEGLPEALRIPAERFRLEPAQDETNPRKTYHWLG